MPDMTQPNSLFEYRVMPWELIVSVLEEVMIRKDLVVSKGTPVVEKMYAHFESIYNAAKIHPEENPFIMVEHAMIRYLDPMIMEYFTEHPDSKAIRDLMAVQINYLDVVVREIPDFKPYTVEELKEIIKGTAPYYDDLMFLGTLRSYLFADEIEDGVADLLFKTLPQGKDGVISGQEFGWDEIFIRSMLVHVVWKFFVFLSLEQQKSLLQNYFYTAVVMGAPVRQWLGYVFKNANPSEVKDLSAQYVQAIMNSNESVPMDTDAESFKTFPEIAKNYLAAVYSGEIGTLAQEKFLSSFYQNQEDGDYFTGWLRETLGVLWRLRQGEGI